MTLQSVICRCWSVVLVHPAHTTTINLSTINAQIYAVINQRDRTFDCVCDYVHRQDSNNHLVQCSQTSPESSLKLENLVNPTSLRMPPHLPSALWDLDWPLTSWRPQLIISWPWRVDHLRRVKWRQNWFIRFLNIMITSLVTDEPTDGRTDGHVENIITPAVSVACRSHNNNRMTVHNSRNLHNTTITTTTSLPPVPLPVYHQYHYQSTTSTTTSQPPVPLPV